MKPSRKYFVLFVGAFAAHIVLLVGVILLMVFLAGVPSSRSSIVDTPLRYLLLFIPVVPVIFAFAIFIRAVGNLDELQRRIQLEAFAFSLGGTGMLTFGYGYLELAGLPHINWLFVLPLMAFLWGAGLVIASRRYR